MVYSRIESLVIQLKKMNIIHYIKNNSKNIQVFLDGDKSWKKINIIWDNKKVSENWELKGTFST